MPESIRHLLTTDIFELIRGWFYLPFVLSTAATVDNKVNKTRMLEAVIIGAVLALGGYLFVVPILENNQKHLQAAFSEVKAEVSALRSDLTATKIKMGDRWTGTQQNAFERVHSGQHKEEWRHHSSNHQ